VNQQLANDTLMGILFNFAFVDGYYETCLKAGISGRRWPAFSGTKLLDIFESVAKEKTIKAAMYEVSEGIEFEFKKDTLPQDIESLKNVFDSACDYLFAKELSIKLKHSPGSFRSLIQEYAATNQNGNEIESIEEMISSFVVENEKRIKNNEFEVLIPGWPVLSSSIGGFNPGRLTIISAGTGVGKTNLCMNLARSLWLSKIPSLYINMEMDLHDVTVRFLTSSLKINKHELKSPDYISKVSSLTDKLAENKKTMFFSSGRALGLTDISVLANEHKEKHGIKFLFVDYDQKITPDTSDDEWKFIQKSCEALEEIAKRLKIHVILLAQADERGDGIPRASKRMLQSASTALFFTKDNDQFFLKALKNRHGQNNFMIELDYDPAKSIIQEGRLADVQKILEDQKAKKLDPKNFR
jgi:hypothetical protein